jgi:hypothetical protein
LCSLIKPRTGSLTPTLLYHQVFVGAEVILQVPYSFSCILSEQLEDEQAGSMGRVTQSVGTVDQKANRWYVSLRPSRGCVSWCRAKGGGPGNSYKVDKESRVHPSEDRFVMRRARQDQVDDPRANAVTRSFLQWQKLGQDSIPRRYQECPSQLRQEQVKVQGRQREGQMLIHP